MKLLDKLRPAASEVSKDAGSDVGVSTNAQNRWITAIEETGVIGREEASLLGITRKAIRRVMDRSGWTAYETFCNMYEVAKKTREPFRNIANKNLWRDYKYEHALMMVGEIPETMPAEPILSEETFRKIFYTRKQRKAMEQVEKGIITAETLCDFFNIKLPDEIMSMEGNLLNKLAFQISNAKNGKIFFCVPGKYVEKEAYHLYPVLRSAVMFWIWQGSFAKKKRQRS